MNALIIVALLCAGGASAQPPISADGGPETVKMPPEFILKDEPADEDLREEDYPARLGAALKALKAAKGAPLAFIACDAKPHAVILIAKKITPAHKKLLTQLAGGDKHFLPAGTVRFQQDSLFFEMEKAPAGLALRLRRSLKHYTGQTLRVVVGIESAE